MKLSLFGWYAYQCNIDYKEAKEAIRGLMIENDHIFKLIFQLYYEYLAIMPKKKYISHDLY